MSQTIEMPAVIPAPVERVPQATPFRFPNPLRAGLVSFVATIAVIGGGMAVLNVAVDRGLDAYYDKQLAALAQPSTDPAYQTARAMAADEETTAGVATASVN